MLRASQDESQLRKALADGRVPTGALICVFLGQVIAAFTGPWLAGRLSGKSRLRAGATAGRILYAASLVNLKALPHPRIFAVGTLVVLPLAACMGILVATRRRSS
jgi:hypothetical protein